MKTKKILDPKCPYCKSKKFTHEIQYIEDEYCEVTATCDLCEKEYSLTFECTMITKLEE